MKVCKTCGEEKPFSEFSPNRKALRPDCKACHADKSRQSVLRRKLQNELAVPPILYDIETLALEYKKSEAWIAKGLQACEIASVTKEYFILRYLKRDKDVVKNDKVEMEFKRLSRR